MDFFKLCSAIYPFLKPVCKDKASLFDFLVCNCIDEEREDLKDDLSAISSKQKRNIVSGRSSFSHTAVQIYGHYDDGLLVEEIEKNVSSTSIENFSDDLSKTFPGIDGENYQTVIADAMKETIESEVKKYRKKSFASELQLKEEMFKQENRTCPLCGKTYLHGLDSMFLIRVDASQPKTAQNVLGVCRHCKNNQASFSKEYLREAKETLVTKSVLLEKVNSLTFDDELATAVKKLLQASTAENEQLSFAGLRIDQKVQASDYSLLSWKIKNYVALTFSRLNDLFHENDSYRHSYEKLASSLRLLFLKLSETTTDKNKIFDMLSNKIQEQIDCELPVAEAIISYFIQDCEVFDEISK